MTASRKHRLILLGAPGAGKGTQAFMLSKELRVPHISTGDILREEVKNQTELGKRANEVMASGLLVPDQTIIEIVNSRLEKSDCLPGYIFDGFPRTVSQARMLKDNHIEIDQVIFIDLPDSILVRRLSGRRVCQRCHKMYHVDFNPPQKEFVCDVCGSLLIIREDDSIGTVKKRIEVYRKQTEPLIEYFQNDGSVRFNVVDGGANGEDTAEHVLARITSVLRD
jgi:adenylate kinase